MSNIPVPYVVVSYSEEVILDIVSSEVAFNSFLKEGSNEALLLNAQNNPNFLDFVHEFRGGVYRMDITMLDPQNQFENTFLLDEDYKTVYDSDSVVNYVPERKYKPKITPAKVQEALEANQKDLGAFLDDLVEDLTDTGLKLLNPYKEIYVAYGVGPNFDNWSGPHCTILAGVNIDISEGVKKIKIRLVPHEKANALNLSGRSDGITGEDIEGMLTLDSYGLDAVVVAKGEDLNFNSGPLYGQGVFNTLKNSDFFKKISTDPEGPESEDYHVLVTDLLRKLGTQIAGLNNVVVVMPDLNIACRTALLEATKDSRNNKSTQKGSGSPTNVEGRQYWIRKPAYDSKTDRKNGFQSAAELFGIKISSVEVTEDRRTSKGSAVANFFGEQFAGGSYRERTIDFFNSRFEPYLCDNVDNILNTAKILYSTLDNIKQAAGTYPFTPVVYFETNAALVKYWRENLNGTHLFGGGQELEKDKPFLVIGDLHAINDVLYSTFFFKKKRIPEVLLHNMDRAIFTNKEYKETVSKIAHKRVALSSAFGDPQFVPSDFAFKDSDLDGATDKLKEILENNTDIPVLLFNTKNPNVLKLDVADNKGMLLAHLTHGIVGRRAKKFAAGIAGILPTKYTDGPPQDPTSVLRYIRNLHNTYGGGEITKEAFDKIAAKLEIDLSKNPQYKSWGNIKADAAGAIRNYKKALKETPDLLLEMDRRLGTDPITVMADFHKRAYMKGVYNISVETLPLFSVSNINKVGKPCLLFAQDQNITNTQEQERNYMNAYLTGQYNIMSFRHQISRGKAFSTFNIVKSPQ